MAINFKYNFFYFKGRSFTFPVVSLTNIDFKTLNSHIMKTKSFLNAVLILPLLTLVLLFSSCQDEVIEIIQDAPDEVLVADSEVATLLQKTSSNDGSKDNILDKSSCFNVALPVHIFINGLEIFIDSERKGKGKADK